MPMFLVVRRRSGPEYDHSKPLEEQSCWDEHAAFMDALVDDGFIVLGGVLGDEVRTAHAVEAESEDAIRERLARDPRSGSHPGGDSIDQWTNRLHNRPTPSTRTATPIPPHLGGRLGKTEATLQPRQTELTPRAA